MFTGILSLFSEKSVFIFVGIVVVLLALSVYWQGNRINSLRTEIATIEAQRLSERAIYDAERSVAKAQIATQNHAIELMKLNAIEYEKGIDELTRLLDEGEASSSEDIRNKLSQDNSLLNQSTIMKDMLKGFSYEK